MPIKNKDAVRIAKHLIAEIAATWIEPSIQCVKQDGSYIFIYTLSPARVVRYGRIVERPAAISTVRFNPLAEATELILHLDFKLGDSVSDESMRDFIIRRDAKQHIQQLLVVAQNVFGDAMWQSRIIAETLCSLDALQGHGRLDIARGLVNSTVKLIEERVREGFGKISEARNPKITPVKIQGSIMQFLPKFRETGEIPSQRQFAKSLDVTPKGWRDFLKNHYLEKHEIIVKHWLEEFDAIVPEA